MRSFHWSQKKKKKKKKRQCQHKQSPSSLPDWFLILERPKRFFNFSRISYQQQQELGWRIWCRIMPHMCVGGHW
jgi:hypothetical protein